MAASIIIEQESGKYTGRVHPHNGYYAGDFTSRPRVLPTTWQTIPTRVNQPSPSAA